MKVLDYLPAKLFCDAKICPSVFSVGPRWGAHDFILFNPLDACMSANALRTLGVLLLPPSSPSLSPLPPLPL